MALFFTESDVEQLLPMRDALRCVEDAFRLLGDGRAVSRPRSRVRLPKLVLHVMSAGSDVLGYAGLKAYTTGPSGARFYFFLFEAGGGELVSILEADRLGQIRTGAATAVATRYLARDDWSRAGIVGTGWQARSQVEALAASKNLTSIVAFSRNDEKKNAFCRQMSEKLGVPVEPARAVEDVAKESDVVVTATNAREPVLLGTWLAPGQHVSAVGSNALTRREIDQEAVTRASFIAVDSVEQARIECGDLAAVVEAGKLAWDDVRELADVVAGKLVFRRTKDDVTLFESQGIAIEDVAVAKLVYERGRASGVGRSLAL